MSATKAVNTSSGINLCADIKLNGKIKWSVLEEGLSSAYWKDGVLRAIASVDAKDNTPPAD
jgi:hypothetical protein